MTITIKSLMDAFKIERSTAVQIKNYISDIKISWSASANNSKLMDKIAELLDCEVEVIRGYKNWHSYFTDCSAIYVNTGDTYSATILYDTDSQRVYLTTWGDWFEQNEKKYELF